MKMRDDLKVLLLQIREDEETMLEEYFEFIQFSQLRESQIDKLNTFQTNTFTPAILENYDALFIGGSSHASVLNETEFLFVKDCKKLVRYCYDNHFPLFASCFGFQIAVEALGGKVIEDKAHMEMGIYQIELSDERKSDPLISDYPHYIWAVSGHQERALKLPPKALALGKSHLCPYHLFTFKNKPFYATQFHPEVDKKDFIARVTRYQAHYIDNAEALQQVIDAAIHDTTQANNLLMHFIDRVVLKTV